jgi:hypothetical protein
MAERNPFDAEAYRAFLSRNLPLKDLRERHPMIWDRAKEDLAAVFASGSLDSITASVGAAQAAHERIMKSGMNTQVLSGAFPQIVKTRMMVLALQNQYMAARTGAKGRVRFNLWNGAILQKVLFTGGGFTRKPVSLALYSLAWPLITQKRYLMPLLYKKGIYCFYSRRFVQGLARMVEGAECLEIGAGDGTLARFLSGAGVKIRATDDRSWSHYIAYPDSVENMEARAALETYSPAVVICSWPPPGNGFERAVFRTRSVRTYVAIGSVNAYASGDRAAYGEAAGFTMTDDSVLARLLLPREIGHAVYVFRRSAAGR